MEGVKYCTDVQKYQACVGKQLLFSVADYGSEETYIHFAA